MKSDLDLQDIYIKYIGKCISMVNYHKIQLQY